MRYLLAILLGLLSGQTFADAGFSIKRRKATSFIRVYGTNKLKNSTLIHLTGYYSNPDDITPFGDRAEVVKEGFETFVQEGGRGWEESDRNVKFFLVNEATGAAVDSIHLFAKKYSYNIRITGDSLGHLQYSIDSTRAVYRYALLDEEKDTMAFSRNRLIFIACSAIGFLLLAGLFIYKRKKIEKIQDGIN